MTHGPFGQSSNGETGGSLRGWLQSYFQHRYRGCDNGKSVYVNKWTPSELSIPMMDPPRICAELGTLKKISVSAVMDCPRNRVAILSSKRLAGSIKEGILFLSF